MTLIAVYGTIGVLWAIMMFLMMLDTFENMYEVVTCSVLNLFFWPLTLTLYLAKKY